MPSNESLPGSVQSKENAQNGWGPQMPIAIIGMSCRMPSEAENPEKLWEMLVNKRSACQEFPASKFNIDAHYHPDPLRAGTSSVRHANFMKDSGRTFDAPFFSISKTEAITMDPQQRLMMESVYEAIENAGIPMEKVIGSETSCFVGAFTQDYHNTLVTDVEQPHKYAPTGNSHSILSNRVSWFYDLQSCSLTLDTACSSSLVATHLACQNLKEGGSEMSIVGGVNVIEHPQAFFDMTSLGFLSPDGRCYSFDHRANGYSRGEGVGTIILKPLEAAIRDGNTIRAVIRNTGVNQDGRTPGMTLPSDAAQERLIRKVYEQAELDLSLTSYVEAHGTGTSVGDPKEAGAISRAWRDRPRDIPLYIGAIKSNIGHLEGASGVAGIIKTVSVLERAVIPPNTNFEKVNPTIPAEEWGIQFPLKPTPFPNVNVRRASINSFGFGGTNAHIVIDDAHSFLSTHNLNGTHRTVAKPPAEADIRVAAPETIIEGEEPVDAKAATSAAANGAPVNGEAAHFNSPNGVANGTPNGIDAVIDATKPATNGTATTASNGVNGAAKVSSSSVPQIFPISSFDEPGVKRTAEALADYLADAHIEDEAAYLGDLAYTLVEKRTPFSWKAFAIGANRDELIKNLPKAASTTVHSRKGVNAKAGFIFTGQGAQWHAMGKDLMVYPVFRESMEAAAKNLKELGSGWDLVEELSKSPEESIMNTPGMSQPACTALQVALVDLMNSWGVQPSRVIGHSSGEIGAAYSAGAFTREAAWKIAFYRGQVSEKLGALNGSMMAVGVDQATLQSYLDKVDAEIEGELTMACFNSPKNITVAGDEKKIDRLGELMNADKLFNRKLNVKNAYHSGHMQTVADEYRELMGTIDPPAKSVRGIAFYSTVAGKVVNVSELRSPQYWVSNMVSPVNFAPTLLLLASPDTGKSKLRVSRGTEAPVQFLLEVGPHPAMQSAARDIFAGDKNLASIPYTYLVQRNKSAVDQTLSAMGKLFCGGFNIDILKVNAAGQTSTHKASMLTDLPPYRFNHSQEYWSEGRYSKNLKHRKHARHDLLGAIVMDWNAQDAKWRHTVRVSENPWLKDHKVTGRVVYPGVGYIVMAVEAARQLAGESEDRVSGFVLRDIAIKTALQVPETDEGVDVQISMSPDKHSSSSDSVEWKAFKITSYNPATDSWGEHCRGVIKLEFDNGNVAVDDGREAAAEKATATATIKKAVEDCSLPFDMSRSYSELETIGLTFGPLFRNLRDVAHSERKGEAIGTVTVPDVAAAMPKNFTHQHVIHPATMDSMLHVFLGAAQTLLGGDKKVSEPMVPVSIKEVRVSRDVKNTPGTAFRTHCLAEPGAHKRFTANIAAHDPETSETKIKFTGMQFVPLQSNATVNRKRQINFNVDWKLDYDQLTNDQIKEHLESIYVPAVVDEESVHKQVALSNLCTIIWVFDTLNNLDGVDEENLPFQLKKYLTWMRFQRDQYNKGEILHQNPEWDNILKSQQLKDEAVAKYESSGPEGEMAARIGKNHAKILRMQIDPLQIMFGDGLMDNYYREIGGTGNIHQFMKLFLDDYGLKQSNLRVLEIGAGTGGTTWPVLEALAPPTSFPRLSKYTYTDISPSFFEKGKAKFKNWSNLMEFMKLDIEKDPLDQGFTEGTYDIIIAANVLHATHDLRNTLGNVRKLLKPGGKLMLQEAVQVKLLSGPLVFGTLPGWWLSKEPERALCPLMSEQLWDETLRNNSFSGLDLVLDDYSNKLVHAQSILVTSAPQTPVADGSKLEVAIVHNESQEALAGELSASLTSLGAAVKTFNSILDAEDVNFKETNIIVLSELEKEVLASIDEDDFAVIRNVLTKSAGLLWVTKSQLEDPSIALATGLIRSVRWERDMDESNLVVMQLDSLKNVVKHVSQIYEHQFITQRGLRNSEYKIEGDMILTNRLVNADYLDEYILSRSGKIPAVPRPFGAEPRRALTLTTDTPGLLNSLQFVDCPVHGTPMNDNEVEVEVKATGLNFRDIMVAMGEVKGNILGAEGAGIVTRVGKGVTKVKPGDRVAMLASLTDVFATFARTLDVAVAKIPDELPFEQAASFPVVGATVVYCLDDLARLKKGESILIHAAAGGVGQAAIMYAQNVGAEIYATVSTNEKRNILTQEYGIPEDHIFSSRDASFAKGIMRQTNGKGVNVILNSLAGEFLRLSWQCIAPFGRFVEIGKRDIYSNASLEMFPFRLNVAFYSADLETVMALDKSLTERLLMDTVKLWEQKVFRELKPLTVYPYSQIEETFRLVQSGKHIGKIVLTANKNDVVHVVPQAPPEYQFKPDASYLLSGGLGGLGRSTARWMISRGAKNIIFTSRSGANTDSIREFVKELEGKGCTVKAFACDVSDKELLRKTLEECKQTMPPIKGCIQGAMQLKDSAFEMMRYEFFRAAVMPKVYGSWNLHELLPEDMDFYIMLSSVCGIIGNRGQSNYAAGNTYQDALAHYRIKRGLPATTIDLGSMLSVGFIAEHQDTINPYVLAVESLREDEYHAVIEHYADPRNVKDHGGINGQVAVGLATRAMFAQKGMPEPSFLHSPLFTLLQNSTDSAGGDGEEEDLGAMRAAIKASKTLEEASHIILETIMKKISSVMATQLEEIDPTKPIHFYGVDSLVAVELRNWLGKNMESSIEILDIMGDDGMNKLADKVAKNSKLISEEVKAA